MNRKKVLLAILLLLFAVAVISSFFRMPRQKTADTMKYRPGSPAASRQTVAAVQVSPSDDTALRLDLLDKEPPRFAGYKRNLFKPVFHEELKTLPLPPPPPPRQRPLPQPASKGAAASQPTPQAEPTPVQRDMANFTFLGFLKNGTRKTIFLSSNKEIFLARKGDRLAGKYEVTSITDEALVITSLTGSGEIVIPLVENKPLAAPSHPKPTFQGESRR